VFAVNEAVTVQFAVIGPVVYIVPDNEPPQPVADAVYPESATIVNVVVAPSFTVCGELIGGVIVPCSLFCKADTV